LADPPWRFETWSEKGRDRCPDGQRATDPVTRYYRNGLRHNRPEKHYATMSLQDIADLPVEDVAAKDCVLLLWAIDSMLPQALAVGASWGFTYKTVGFYWAKMRREGSTRASLHLDLWHKLFPMGTGYWTRPNVEQCLLFTRGSPKRLSASVRKLIIARRREHSQKPNEQYASIEALVGGPYLELFARNTRKGWSSWGNEVGVRDGLFAP
jgi:N6-adenosine-specific RNA methylase IME4